MGGVDEGICVVLHREQACGFYLLEMLDNQLLSWVDWGLGIGGSQSEWPLRREKNSRVSWSRLVAL